MKQAITALLTAAALLTSAAPLCIFAEDTIPEDPSDPVVTDIQNDFVKPDWMPDSYEEAIDFYNTHGATYVQDGYVCFTSLTPAQKSEDEEKFSLISSEPPVCHYSPQQPEKLPAYVVNISVFQPSKTGTLKLSVVRAAGSAPSATAPLAEYSFSTRTDGVLEETDIYRWLPDCIGEFNDFDAANPAFSLHDGYLVYCGQVNGSYMFTTYLDQIGTGAVKKVRTCSVDRAYPFANELPCGDSIPELVLYCGAKAGDVKLTVSQMALWNKEMPVLYSDSACFSVAEDLTITEIPHLNEGALPGDCNGDGAVDLLDLIALQKYLHNHGTLAKPELADLDHDGTVDIFDLALLEHNLLVQSPWKDGEMKFESENVLFRPRNPELHKDYDVKWFGKLDAVTSYITDYSKNESVKLEKITEDTFKEHSVLVVSSPAGAGSRTMTVDSVERKGSRLIIHTTTLQDAAPTPDMAVLYTVLAVDSNVTNGIKEMVVDNQNLVSNPENQPVETPVVPTETAPATEQPNDAQ